MQDSTTGLRERKRVETRDKLEAAAVELVLKNGMEHATLDAICDVAAVSTRTFFNYFDSKEDAILGLHEVELAADAVADVRAQHPAADIVEVAVRLMFRVLTPSIASSNLVASRRKVLKQYPQLLGRLANQMQRMSDQLSAAILPVLRESAPASESPDDSEVSAELILALCSGAARAAVKEWATNGNRAPIEAVEERAIELVTNTVK